MLENSTPEALRVFCAPSSLGGDGCLRGPHLPLKIMPLTSSTEILLPFLTIFFLLLYFVHIWLHRGLAAARGIRAMSHGIFGCSTRAQQLGQGAYGLSSLTRTEFSSPALEGGFSTTGPPGKSLPPLLCPVARSIPRVTLVDSTWLSCHSPKLQSGAREEPFSCVNYFFLLGRGREPGAVDEGAPPPGG